MSVEIGSIWRAHGSNPPRYVRVRDSGPDRALVVRCNVLGQVFYTLGRGYDEPRMVALNPAGTALKRYTRVGGAA